ncbi:DUF2304 domain-containing protein [bacterium]|nr:DUF2304 domain-containing protein [bacterium]
MQIRIQILTMLMGVILLLVIFQLIRKNRLLEQYSLLWIASAVLLFIMAAWRGLLEKISHLIGIYYPPSALFVLAIFCGMVIALHFSVVISKLTKENNTLAQKVAILGTEIKSLNDRMDSLS